MTASHQNRKNQPERLPPRRGVVAVVAHESRLLVIRRSRIVVAPLAFCFPGGGIEAGETEPEALEREFMEELGAVVRPVRCIWRCVTVRGIDLAWWLADLDRGAPLVANPDEVDAFYWHTPEEIGGLPGLLKSNLDFLAALRAGEITLSP